jgi:hypothetical protein
MLKRFAGRNGEGLSARTYAHPVTVITESTVFEIRDGEVVLLDNRFRQSCLPVDNVVLSKVEPNDVLYGDVVSAGLPAIKIGDAREVRNLRAAVTEGANAGLTLDDAVSVNANGAVLSRLPTEVVAS